MRLKIKNFNWLAGRPVIIINKETSIKLNVHVDERVSLSSRKEKVYAIVDIFENLVKTGEIGLSHEISSILKLKNNARIEVSSAGISFAGQLIKKKLAGQRLNEKEINILISDIVHNDLTESEIAYFVAAEKLRGMSPKEVLFLTEAMIKQGNKIHFNHKIIADKHCTGGIAGNRTTPILVSICAAAGLILPKTSSRAITSASGTADVIETIANVEFSAQEIKKIVEKTNACLVWGGSLGLAPSDDKIIHVERILNLDVEPQLVSSIMSKKIAAGSNHILIDIPFGGSAKSKNPKQAKQLAEKFHNVAEHFKVKIKTVFTSGKQPIGNGIGPVLEMKDVLAVLQNKPNAPKDLRKKSLFLSSKLLKLCEIKNSKKLAEEILNSGKAYEKFKEIINTQNNKSKDSTNFELKTSQLKLAKFSKTIFSRKQGKITEINNKKINSTCRILGTPENQGAGIYLYKHLGKIQKSEKILTLYSETKDKLKDALRYFKENQPVVIE